MKRMIKKALPTLLIILTAIGVVSFVFYKLTYSYFTKNAPKHYTGLLKYLWGFNWEITKCDMVEEEYDGKYVRFRYLAKKDSKKDERIEEKWNDEWLYIEVKGPHPLMPISVILQPQEYYTRKKEPPKDLDLEKLKYRIFYDTSVVEVYTNPKGTIFLREPRKKGINYNDIPYNYYSLSPDKSFVADLGGFSLTLVEDHNVIWDRIKVFWYNLNPVGDCYGTPTPSRCHLKIEFKDIRISKCSMLSFRRILETFEFKKTSQPFSPPR
ncbi:MAG: hypothetical protein ACP5SD_07955 [Elusimicrobiales bacterium]|nr:hypothetical protein [Elusimicrobiales bacterium]HPO95106.1 hypothetical protein [Elusimicrobiales bacterium]